MDRTSGECIGDFRNHFLVISTVSGGTDNENRWIYSRIKDLVFFWYEKNHLDINSRLRYHGVDALYWCRYASGIYRAIAMLCHYTHTDTPLPCRTFVVKPLLAIVDRSFNNKISNMAVSSNVTKRREQCEWRQRTVCWFFWLDVLRFRNHHHTPILLSSRCKLPSTGRCMPVR